MTIFETAKAKAALKAERSDNGLCIECGEPATLNADNSRSRYCDPCRAQRVNADNVQRRKNPHQMQGRGRPPVSDDDIVTDNRECSAYRELLALITTTLFNSRRPMTKRELYDRIGRDGLNRQWADEIVELYALPDDRVLAPMYRLQPWAADLLTGAAKPTREQKKWMSNTMLFVKGPDSRTYPRAAIEG